MTVKYAPTGTLNWSEHYAAAGADDTSAGALAVDTRGNVYLAATAGTNGVTDFATVRYDAGGNQSASVAYNAIANSNRSEPSAIVVRPDGIVLVGGGEKIGSGAERMVVQQILPDATAPGINLAIAISAPSFVDGGAKMIYQITARNVGTLDANGVIVQDAVPPNLLNAIWTCTAIDGASCSANGAGNIVDVVDLTVGSTVVYQLSGTARAIPEGALVNVARVDPPAGATDIDASNDSVSVTSTVGIFRNGFE